MLALFLAGALVTAETQEAVASEKKEGDSFWASTMAEALDAVSSEKKEGDVAPVSTTDNKDDGGAATYTEQHKTLSYKEWKAYKKSERVSMYQFVTVCTYYHWLDTVVWLYM